MLNAPIAQGQRVLETSGSAARTAVTQKVVVINDSPEVLQLLETVLEAGQYDVVFVESNEHAYSQVKRVRPDLVILCMRIDDMGGFQVLSMLKLDGETRGIPVLTYTTDCDAPDGEEDATEVSETAMFTSRPAGVMN
jgi:CheY-like chemotaxis protein